jgi:hypothetical protein
MACRALQVLAMWTVRKKNKTSNFDFVGNWWWEKERDKKVFTGRSFGFNSISGWLVVEEWRKSQEVHNVKWANLARCSKVFAVLTYLAGAMGFSEP